MPTSTSDDRKCSDCRSTDVAGTWGKTIGGNPMWLCEDCVDKRHRKRDERYAKLHSERWQRIRRSMPRAGGWSLANFPAQDAAGRQALELARRWLVTQGIVTRSDGTIVDSDNEDEFYDTWQEIAPDSVDDADYKTGAYVYGGIGSGKTSLCWSMLRAVHEGNTHDGGKTDLRFANIVSLIAEAKRAMNDDDTEDPFPALKKADVLVLDDLGAERVTSWVRSSILELVQHRYDNQRATIVSSNYAPSSLARRLGQATREEPAEPLLGQRIVSRLCGEDAVKIKLDRPDLRARKQAA